MQRQIGSIVVMGLLAMLALAMMASYGSSKNPRLRLKLAIEHDLPVSVERCELVDEHGWRPRLVLRVVPRPGAAPPTDLATRVALAVVAPQPADGPAPPSFDQVDVDVPGAATVAYDRVLLVRWRRLGEGLATFEAAVAPKLGPGSKLAIFTEEDLLGVEARPTLTDLAPRDAARAVLAATKGFDVIRIAPPKGAGEAAKPETFRARDLLR